VPDTGKLDVRVVDIVQQRRTVSGGLPHQPDIPAGNPGGTRHIKVFIHSTNPDTAKLFLVDTTFSFVVNEPYSFYVAGFARAGATPRARAVIAPATLPTLGPTQFCGSRAEPHSVPGGRHDAGHDRRGGCVDQAGHRDVDGNAGRDERRVWRRVPVRRPRHGPV